jgi:hypothetical protein
MQQVSRHDSAGNCLHIILIYAKVFRAFYLKVFELKFYTYTISYFLDECLMYSPSHHPITVGWVKGTCVQVSHHLVFSMSSLTSPCLGLKNLLRTSYDVKTYVLLELLRPESLGFESPHQCVLTTGIDKWDTESQLETGF